MTKKIANRRKKSALRLIHFHPMLIFTTKKKQHSRTKKKNSYSSSKTNFLVFFFLNKHLVRLTVYFENWNWFHTDSVIGLVLALLTMARTKSGKDSELVKPEWGYTLSLSRSLSLSLSYSQAWSLSKTSSRRGSRLITRTARPQKAQ